MRTRTSNRVIEAGAITALLPVIALIPVWLLALFVLWLPVTVFVSVPFVWFSLGHLALGLLLFLRPVQRLVLARLMGARPPDPDELAALAPAWKKVAQAAGVHADRFVLHVVDDDDINAFACGGHLLVVSSYAATSLPDDELAGVLAHELSHHLGSHTVALTIGQWLSLPILLLARIGFSMQNVAQAAADTLMQRSALLVVLGRTLSTLLTAVSWVFLAGLLASNAIANVVSRGAEFQADRRAIDMGFGRELSRALRRVVAHSGPPPSKSISHRLRTSHPPARTRVARIDATLRGRRHPSMGRPPPAES